MALKPDITLSIVKNARTIPFANARYYYNENVYRISENTHDCKEIKQCGIELLGNVDSHATAEIVLLALKSLEKIDFNSTLIISHIAFVSSALKDAGIFGERRRKILGFIKRKNRHDLLNWCEENNVNSAIVDRLVKISSISGTLSEVLPLLKELVTNESTAAAYDELLDLYNALSKTDLYRNLKFDLSVLNHLDYYNGILLQGYVKNSPSPVLSGGRYDSLAKKIRGDGGAFGFAVYLDGLNLHYPNTKEFDCDALIIYEQSDSNLLMIVNDLCQKGETVRVERQKPDSFKAKKIYEYKNGSLTEVAE
jgi:ATP phosphoribosyltransferase regulatory subunit